MTDLEEKMFDAIVDFPRGQELDYHSAASKCAKVADEEMKQLLLWYRENILSDGAPNLLLRKNMKRVTTDQLLSEFKNRNTK